jgi:hypothetical protein
MEDSTKKSPTGQRMKQGKRRWSVIDTVILLLVLLAIGGAVLRVVDISRKDRLNRDETMYVISFTVDDTHPDVLAEIRGTDAVYLYEEEAFLGYVGMYRSENADDNLPALTIIPSKSDAAEGHVGAEGHLVCTTGTALNGGLLIGKSGRYLIPGSEVTVRTDRVLLTLRITEIRKLP